ncbi:hypothetical protein B0H16DRAFT_1482028 [Mycena metata]|uniref:Uncharacterized protein n=1 Tax=Mycena metata TaxID=1033252 RepID=A0AAD7GUW7_9AGAR|nr:hypothetical protein B0H16DRAFT_1482028 [Mycena metata]
MLYPVKAGYRISRANGRGPEICDVPKGNHTPENALKNSKIHGFEPNFGEREGGRRKKIWKMFFGAANTLYYRSYQVLMVWSFIVFSLVFPTDRSNSEFATNYSFDGTYSDDRHLRGLFSCLRLVHTIDISEFEGGAFRALRDVTFRATLEAASYPPLPLTHLMLYRENVADVVSFVSLYHPLGSYSTSALLFLQLDLSAGVIPPAACILRTLVPEVLFTSESSYYISMRTKSRLNARAPTAHAIITPV